MALNPVAYTEHVVRSFLRYQLTAYPFADTRLHGQMRDLLSLDETRRSPLLKGPYVSLSRPFRQGAAVDALIGEGLLLRAGLQDALDGATVESAVFRTWRALRNSELIEKACQHGFTTLVTSDKRLAKEQRHFPIAVVVVDDNRLGPFRASLGDIAQAIRETPAGAHRMVRIITNPRLTRD